MYKKPLKNNFLSGFSLFISSKLKLSEKYNHPILKL